MKNSTKLLVVFISLFNLSCKGQNIQNESKLILEISNLSYSKIPPKYDVNLLSRITKFNAKYFTSAIGGTYDNKRIDYPINDKMFNHSFFNSFDYDPKRKVKLHIQKYSFENKVYFVAIKIE